MPTYEYACRDCGEHLEVVQSFKDDPLTVCPNCNGALRKVFSAAGIIFKGSGWHIKDYASKPKDAAKSNAEGGGPAKSSGSKSESKSVSSSPEGGRPTRSGSGDTPASTSKDGPSKSSDSSSSSTPEAKSA